MGNPIETVPSKICCKGSGWVGAESGKSSRRYPGCKIEWRYANGNWKLNQNWYWRDGIESWNLHLAENREILNGFVVISNEIYHLVGILSELLSIHWLQPTLPAYPCVKRKKLSNWYAAKLYLPKKKDKKIWRLTSSTDWCSVLFSFSFFLKEDCCREMREVKRVVGFERKPRSSWWTVILVFQFKLDCFYLFSLVEFEYPKGKKTNEKWEIWVGGKQKMFVFSFGFCEALLSGQYAIIAHQRYKITNILRKCNAWIVPRHTIITLYFSWANFILIAYTVWPLNSLIYNNLT